jgi:hypothetical protein
MKSVQKKYPIKKITMCLPVLYQFFVSSDLSYSLHKQILERRNSDKFFVEEGKHCGNKAKFYAMRWNGLPVPFQKKNTKNYYRVTGSGILFILNLLILL